MARRFVFRLETVQRVRALREQQAQRDLAAERAAITQLEQANAAAQREIAATHDRLVGAQRGAQIDATELARGRAWVAQLRAQILQREHQIAQHAAKLEALLDVWRMARKELKVIEKLRERRYAAYADDLRRREQLEQDEVAQRMQAGGSVIGALRSGVTG
jgi:flagellar export protein FliJ